MATKKVPLSQINPGLYRKVKVSNPGAVQVESTKAALPQASDTQSSLDELLGTVSKPKAKKAKKAPIFSSTGSGKGAMQRDKAKQARTAGYDLQVQGLNLSSIAVKESAGRNIQRMRQEEALVLEDAARQFQSLSSTQRAEAGSSGIDIFSVSFQQVYAEAANAYSRDVMNRKEILAANEQTAMADAIRQAEAYVIQIQSVRAQQQLDNATNDYEAR